MKPSAEVFRMREHTGAGIDERPDQPAVQPRIRYTHILGQTLPRRTTTFTFRMAWHRHDSLSWLRILLAHKNGPTLVNVV